MVFGVVWGGIIYRGAVIFFSAVLWNETVVLLKAFVLPSVYNLLILCTSLFLLTTGVTGDLYVLTFELGVMILVLVSCVDIEPGSLLIGLLTNALLYALGIAGFGVIFLGTTSTTGLNMASISSGSHCVTNTLEFCKDWFDFYLVSERIDSLNAWSDGINNSLSYLSDLSPLGNLSWDISNNGELSSMSGSSLINSI